MGIFAWQAPLNTLTGHSRKKSTFKSTNLGRGRGGLRISTLCTNRKMLTIVNGPLRPDIAYYYGTVQHNVIS